MNNTETLATQDTKGEEKQTKNTTKYVPDTTRRNESRYSDLTRLKLNLDLTLFSFIFCIVLFIDINCL